MNCPHCQKEIAENSNFCYFCGSRQAAAAPPRRKRLARSAANRMFGGVCGGLGEFIGVDPTIVRFVWVLLLLVPGFFVFEILAYFIAWLVMPEMAAGSVVVPQKRLYRSRTERKLAGICGGLGDFIGVDPTILRIVWVVLAIVPGAILFGLLSYIAAWFVIPEAPLALASPAGEQVPQAAPSN